MDSEIRNSTWDKEDIKLLDEFEYNRNLVLRATNQLLSEFYSKHFNGDERVLEVGSGTGFLKRNWPKEFNGEWTQLDAQEAFLQEAEKRFPKGTYIEGSAYDLPFEDNSLDVVCGYGSYDVLYDLDAAINEAKRVLKDGGLFFHMLDLFPAESPIEEDHFKRKIQIQSNYAPSNNGKSQVESISYIPEENFERFNRLESKVSDSIEFERAMRIHDAIWKTYSREIKTHDYFAGKLVQLLTLGFGHKNVQSGKLTSKFKGERTEQQKEEIGEPFFYHFDAGMLYRKKRITSEAYRFAKNFSQNLTNSFEPDCIEISTVKYAMARK